MNEMLNWGCDWGYLCPVRTPCMVGYLDVCLLLVISMHWQQGNDFESKGDNASSSAEFRIRTQGRWNRIFSRLNARWQTDWAIGNQAKNLNPIACPYPDSKVHGANMGTPGSCRPQMGPMLAPSNLLRGYDQQTFSPLDPTAGVGGAGVARPRSNHHRSTWLSPNLPKI